MNDYPKNPDDPSDEVTAYLTLAVRRSGAMSVSGCINDEKYALALLATAIDTVRAHHRRNRGEQSKLIVPAHDTALS